ncbi:unnamed protein product [Cuscuta epithymum]|nr:unnamed protein product [Cuscuta epithymum]
MPEISKDKSGKTRKKRKQDRKKNCRLEEGLANCYLTVPNEEEELWENCNDGDEEEKENELSLKVDKKTDKRMEKDEDEDIKEQVLKEKRKKKNKVRKREEDDDGRDEEEDAEGQEEEADDEVQEIKKVVRSSGSGIIGTESFATMGLSELTMESINEMGFEYMTQVTNEGLKLGYCVIPSAKRFIVLYSFLKKNLSNKVMVFFSSCNSVKFHSELLRYIHIDCLDIHGKQKQQKRTSTFFDFCKAEKGILLGTDVAARGLDIPAVDWIIQYDPPDEPKNLWFTAILTDFSLLCTTLHHTIPTILNSVPNLFGSLIRDGGSIILYKIICQVAKVPVKQYEFDDRKLASVQSHLEKLVSNNYYLNKSAKEAYRSYILAYNLHSMKDIFNVHHLDLQAVATSFCFSSPPKININIDSNAAKCRKKHKGEGRRNGFSESRPISSILVS